MRVSRLFTHNNNNNNNNNLKQSKIVSIFPLKNAKKKSLLTFRVYNPNTRNGHSLLYKNFIRESARENPHTSSAREYQNDVVFIALLDFNPILESFDVLFDVQRDE